MLMRSSTTVLMVEASWKVHVTVGELSLTEVGVCQVGGVMVELNMASWNTSTTNSRSKLVMVTSVLVQLTISWMISAVHLTCQVKFLLSLFGSIQPPLDPRPKASV